MAGVEKRCSDVVLTTVRKSISKPERIDDAKFDVSTRLWPEGVGSLDDIGQPPLKSSIIGRSWMPIGNIVFGQVGRHVGAVPAMHTLNRTALPVVYFAATCQSESSNSDFSLRFVQPD